VKDALRTAIANEGREKFAQIAGVSQDRLESLTTSSEFVPMTLVSLACQLNKSHGDTNPEITSVTECIKGAMIRLPHSQNSRQPEEAPRSTSPRVERPGRQRQARPIPFLDPKSGRLLGFGVNLATFLILGYFLGGFALSPILGFAPCEGLSPCIGSVLGLFISAMASLAYTYYYFVKRV